MSLDEIKNVLKEYDLNGLLEFSTKLGIILFHTSGGPKDLNRGQVNIVRSLYEDKEERDKFVKLLSAAVVRNKAKDAWGLFSKQSVLFFLKLSLENCATEGGKLVSPELTPELAKVLYSITDHLDETDFKIPAVIVPADYSRVKLREFMFRRLEFSVEEKFPNPLYRYMKIITYLTSEHKEFDFDKCFKEATGVSVKTFYNIGAMLAMKWGVKKEEFNLDGDWYIDKRVHFKEVKVSKSTIDKIYKLLVFDPADYASIYAESIPILHDKDIYNYNYLFLRKLPLVKVADYLLACPSPEYFIARITEGPYWIVSEYLQRIGDTKRYNDLPTYWGKAFERYAHERLEKIFHSDYQRVLEEKDSKRVDGLYEGKKSILLFEMKSIHISYQALITGMEQDLARPLEQCFGKKHGVIQQVAHAKDIKEGKFTLKDQLGSRKILPILILPTYLPSEPFSYMFFQRVLRANGVKFSEPYLLPFIYLSIEEVEFLEALASEMSSEDIEQLLVEYSQKVSQADLGNDFSFKNYLFTKGLQIPLNKSLMEDFSKHIDALLKRYFTKEQYKQYLKSKSQKPTE